MKIRQNQIDLIETLFSLNTNIIVVLSCGAPVEMPWLHNCKALVHGYLGGQAGARAMLDVLTGHVCPSGKLAESYPLLNKDTPCYNYYPGTEKTAEYREGIFVGYRYYDTAGIKVRFPFGYGLSYTYFEYSDIKTDASQVSFCVTNKGLVYGAEICQIYIGKQESNVFRPQKELKGFTKVRLNPGQSKAVVLKLDDKAFRYFDKETGKFEIESGEYVIYVGASSRDIRLCASVQIDGTKTVDPQNDLKIPSYYSGKITDVSDREYESLLGFQIQEAKFDKSEPLRINDTLSQMFYAKSLIARLVYKILAGKTQKTKAGVKADMNVLFIFNMPFRGLIKLTGGIFDSNMADSLLTIVNGRFFYGIYMLIRAWGAKRRANKLFAKQLNTMD